MLAVKVPVFTTGRSARLKVTFTVLGSVALHGAPPPVQAEEGSVTTDVADEVLAVDEAQAVPRPAEPQ
jgi:hypothetical protein